MDTLIFISVVLLPLILLLATLVEVNPRRFRSIMVLGLIGATGCAVTACSERKERKAQERVAEEVRVAQFRRDLERGYSDAEKEHFFEKCTLGESRGLLAARNGPEMAAVLDRAERRCEQNWAEKLAYDRRARNRSRSDGGGGGKGPTIGEAIDVFRSGRTRPVRGGGYQGTPRSGAQHGTPGAADWADQGGPTGQGGFIGGRNGQGE